MTRAEIAALRTEAPLLAAAFDGPDLLERKNERVAALYTPPTKICPHCQREYKPAKHTRPSHWVRQKFCTTACYHTSSRQHALANHRDTPRSYLYGRWVAIKQRCYDKNLECYPSYGGRGIRMFDLWIDAPLAFVDYVMTTMGPRPSSKHSIDRIDNDGDYAPGNIRWATTREQARNRRNTRKLQAFGVTLCLKEWAEIAGIKYEILHRRVASEWPLELALIMPPGTRMVTVEAEATA